MSSTNISLQINLAPVDYPYARYILKHQLRKLSHLVSEVVLTLDLHRSKGRFAGDDWEENNSLIHSLIEQECSNYKNVKLVEVDYTRAMQKKLSLFFANGKYKIPFKDNRGGPYYSYLFGLFSTNHDLVFHLDSDMLLMGDPEPWLNESISILDTYQDYLVCCPASSPPLPNHSFINAIKKNNGQDYFDFTTRFFLMNKKRIKGRFERKLPGLDRIINASIRGNPIYQAPEKSLSVFMKKNKLRRIEFPGDRGFISLHPATRTSDFFKSLLGLIDCLDNNDFPEDQRGLNDITDKFISKGIKRLIDLNQDML